MSDKIQIAIIGGGIGGLSAAVSLLQAKATTTPRRVPQAKRADAVPARERISVRARPLPLINYSLLHNGQSPLSSLVIERARVEGPIRDIQVTVELQQPLPLQPYADNRVAGALIVVDPASHRTSGALLVQGDPS